MASKFGVHANWTMGGGPHIRIRAWGSGTGITLLSIASSTKPVEWAQLAGGLRGTTEKEREREGVCVCACV